MNHKHRKVLHAIFSHPVSGNISARAVEALLKDLGAEIEQRHGGRLGVRLNGHFAEFSHDTHALSPEHVRHLHKFLADAGVDPVHDYPL
nr:MAG: hypothetical protein E4H34_04430 [Hyphomicrobiales bacterium]